MSVGFDLRCVRQETRLADRRVRAFRARGHPMSITTTAVASLRSAQQPISNKLPCPSTTHELSCVIPSVSWLSMRFPETWAYVVPHVANHVASSVCRERFKDGGMCRQTTALVLCWRRMDGSLPASACSAPSRPAYRPRCPLLVLHQSLSCCSSFLLSIRHARPTRSGLDHVHPLPILSAGLLPCPPSISPPRRPVFRSPPHAPRRTMKLPDPSFDGKRGRLIGGRGRTPTQSLFLGLLVEGER